MRLNKELLERAMKNAKNNFDKACDKVMDAFKALDESMDKFQKELMSKNKEENHECQCNCCNCHCHDEDGDKVEEAVEPNFELNEFRESIEYEMVVEKEDENKDNE